MSRSAMELDFFRMEKESSSPKSPSKKLFERRRSFRDIQNVVSKIRPEVVKNVIARHSVPSTPKEDQSSFPGLPVYVPNDRPSCGSLNSAETAPLTIFYNGTVAVFNVSHDKAENILKLAEEANSRSAESIDSGLAVSSSDQRQLQIALNGDLPIARRKSLERFLEKRKERHSLASPYGCPSPTNSDFAGQNVQGTKDEKKI